MRSYLTVVCLIVFGLIVAGPTAARAERRFAFVAGIDAYPSLGAEAQLQRAVQDASTVADTLQGLGFAVTRVTDDGTQVNLLRQFEAFVAQLQAGDIVLVFFSGHGVGLGGANYLIPADIPKLQIGDERLLKTRALAETDLVDDIRGRNVGVIIMVIDACRNNPFPREGTRSLGLGRGFVRFDPPEGVMSIYAAGAGQEALDRLPGEDTDKDSVFTRVFVKYLKQPGLNLSALGDAVRDDVAALSNHLQVPGVYGQIVGQSKIFLAGPPADPAKAPGPVAELPPVSATPPPPQPPAQDPEIAYNKAVLENTMAAYETLLKAFPNHPKKETILALYQMKTEESVWTAMEQTDDPALKLIQLDRLLKVFPKGVYAERAQALKNQLTQQPVTPPPPPPVADTSQQDFDAAQAANTPEAWTGFLNAHQSGTLAELARFKQRELSTRALPEPPPPSETAPGTAIASRATSQLSYVDGIDPLSAYPWLALRNAPNKQAPWSDTHMPNGTLLTVLGESGEFYHVRLASGETGWAGKRYIRCCRAPDAAPVMAAAADPAPSGGKSYYYVTGIDPNSRYPWLALRTAPNPQSGWSDTHLTQSVPLTVLGRSGDYYHVRLRSGETGWASARYIECCRRFD